MSSLSCSNVTSVGRSNECKERDSYHKSDRHIPPRSSLHHYEQANLSVSVPDLLKLKEMKDSDASDADDEASRDFDTVGSLPLPSYQSPILNQFCNSNDSVSQIRNLHTSLDSDIISFNSNDNENKSHHMFPFDSTSNDTSCHIKSSKSEIKPLPSYEALYNVSTYSQSEPNAQTASKEDSQEKFRVQKLRIYTKGKKPEAPKIFPVPFSLEESEICKILERKDSTKSLKAEDSAPSRVHNLQSSLSVDSDSFSENIAYASREEIDPKSNISPKALPHSYRPDVVPSVQVDERVPNEKYSPSKSPNSAPYYYSDLYSDKTSPPKSTSTLLNNVKSRSPSYSSKGDIGRKVNKIDPKTPAAEEKDVLNEKYWENEGAKINLKCSIDILESSKSKYLDAEKNKYEAGHTLEKTRSNSTMSYFKHRSSTPELTTCQYQSDEPVYENIVFQPKSTLQKRLSQSLEGLAKAPKVMEDISNNQEDMPGNPVYENIDFYSIDRHKVSEILQAEKLENPPQSPGVSGQNSNKVMSHNMPAIAERQFCTAVYSRNEVEQCNDNLNSNDNEDFLDQNVLRRVSEQHFFGKNFKPQYLPQHQNLSEENNNSLLNYSSFHKLSRGNTLNINEVKDCQNSLQGSLISKLCDDQKNRMYESDSTSGATSSWDEASLDSDSRHHITSAKISSTEIPRGSSEIHFKEPNHLKKLVQQSEGLMCKGKRLSVSAGDLLGKTHEELVLLLIQLRRNQSKILRAKEKLELQMENLQEYLHLPKTEKTSKKQIQLLEKQHEVTQPLVTLVDNMVKLGSLYGSSNRRSFSLPLLDTSQEDIASPTNGPLSPDCVGESNILSKLLAEESTFQKRISEIYSLDKGLRHETNSISSLHQDKEMLEYTLNGMHNKILDHQDRPNELQKLKKQQKMIEKELKDSQHNRADIEAELSRVQNVLDELANHRHEINNTVLKLKGETLPAVHMGSDFRASPPGIT
ncbi:pleckstrin y domain-containing family A member 7, partial [Caerostris extrusa]